jgi:chromosome segregation protein
MYLKSLTINGFKSFADRTRLEFLPGVTAVVGPNGCGKSNIADSIRWVLGEQSAKALRGGKMVDVIFEGTDTRKPLALCEVSIILTECEKQLGAEFHEVEITRRVSRDGQGEYFLNGKACRLKDIQKLFMDTGVGRSSYSVMAQGQIDQILSSKPEERREIFEEAAGITKYKAQRREALAKLAATDANLSRVNDVVAEVGRQIGSLRRQAAKALRFRKLNTRLRHLDLAHKARHWGDLAGTLATAAQEVARLAAEVEAQRSGLDARKQQLDDRRAERSDLNQRLQQAQQSTFDLRTQAEQARNAAQMARVKQVSLQERIAETNREIESIAAQLLELEAELSNASRDKNEQISLLAGSDEEFQVRNREVLGYEQRISQIERDLQQRKLGQLEAESMLVRSRSDLTNLEVDQKTSVARKARIAEDTAEVRREREAAANALNEQQARVSRAQEEVLRLRSAAEAAKESQAQALAAFRETQKAIQDLDRGLAQKTARLRTLQQLAESYEGFSEGAKALLQGRLPAGVPREAITPVSQQLSVGREYARAAEAILGGAMEALCVADTPTASLLFAHLEAEELGRATVLVREIPEAGVFSNAAPAALTDLLSNAAATFLTPEARERHPELARLLSACWIARDLGEFLEAWRAAPDFRFLLVATPQGELVDARGLVSGGHLKVRKSILTREVEIQDLQREIVQEQAALEAARVRAAEADARMQEAARDLEDARHAGEEAGRVLSATQADERNAARAVADIDTRLARLEREAEGIEQEAGEAIRRFERLKQQMTEAEERLNATREVIFSLEKEMSALRQERDERREELAQARLELAEKRQRVELLDRGLSELGRRVSELRRRRDECVLQTDAWTEQLSHLESEIAGQTARAAELDQTLKVAQESVETIRNKLIEVDAAITAAESETASLRESGDRLQIALKNEEIRLTEMRSRSSFLAEEAQREYQIDLNQIRWDIELWKAGKLGRSRDSVDLDEDENPDVDAPVEVPGTPTDEELAALADTDWHAVSTEILALRARLGSMGPVNLVAIDEYRELKQRFDFLNSQVNDLAASKSQLIAAIDEINRVSLTQFRETFEQVRRNFEHTFQSLFGGGRAELILTENPEDPLDSGIEIIAQPPATKLKSLTLLSGGQKALTAVALLFGIYLVKPSPFCLLDELDAPLDETNVGRFTALLKQFSAHSQFVIITHNKRTISAAGAIYGVTMQERGVSKVVSMRFNTDRHDALAVDELVARDNAVRSENAAAAEAATAATDTPAEEAPTAEPDTRQA